MKLDKSKQYVLRVGSDHQHRLHWDGTVWRYEVLAGGVLFDELTGADETEIEEAVNTHGIDITSFEEDPEGEAAAYSQEVKTKIKKFEAAGLTPCTKHGVAALNEDNTCEACQKDDYPDDYKGTEGS